MRSLLGGSRELSISSRLLLTFLAIAMIPCGVLTALIGWISARSLEDSSRRSLLMIAENRVEAIENLAKERRADVAVASQLPTVATSTRNLRSILKQGSTETEEYKKEIPGLKSLFDLFSETYSYHNAYIFDTDGTVLYKHRDDLNFGANLKQGPLKDSELADGFERASSLLQAVFADYQLYPGEAEALAFVVHPIIDGEGKFIGVLALQVKIGNGRIFRLLTDYNGLGDTGEIEVASLNGEQITYVAPMRFDLDAGFKRTVKLGDTRDEAIQRAVKGGRGFGEMVDYRDRKVLAVWAYIPSLRWGIVVKQEVSEAYRLIDQLRMVVVLLLSLTGVVVGTVAILVARTLSLPIRDAAEVAGRVAAGDLTAKLKTTAHGEAGQLLRAISKMTGDLRSLIGNIQRSSITLMSAVTQIAATSRHQEQTVNEYGASTNEAAAAVEEICATGRELLRMMTEVNQVATSTATMARDGQTGLSGMDKTMRMLAESTGSISAKLAVISERAATINLVVTTITKVADQTNLLSINAAIEAEKAGEYGLGFLVVAREIRRLADQTAVSTLDIERMVKEMQHSVTAGVMEMDKFRDQVRQGVGEVAQLGQQLGSIIVAVRGLSEQFDAVNEGVRVQSQGAEQIREAVVHICEGAGTTLASLREFNEATVHLREAIGSMKDEVARFQVEETRHA